MIHRNSPPVRPIAKIIAYYRLDEPEPGKTDTYGLEDQRRDVARFAADCNATIVWEFTEVASGEKDWEESSSWATPPAWPELSPSHACRWQAGSFGLHSLHHQRADKCGTRLRFR